MNDFITDTLDECDDESVKLVYFKHTGVDEVNVMVRAPFVISMNNKCIKTMYYANICNYFEKRKNSFLYNKAYVQFRF